VFIDKLSYRNPTSRYAHPEQPPDFVRDELTDKFGGLAIQIIDESLKQH